MYKIVQAPNDILRNPTQPVNFDISRIIEEMKKTLVAQNDPEGVGLAANQVNLPHRLFLARFDTKKNSPIHVFINPEIIEKSEEIQEENQKGPLEGCLSLPKYYGAVKRHKWVKVKYLNEKIEEKVETFEDFPAVVIQHEMDHLNGKIFVERILEQGGKIYKITGRDKKGKETWEEVDI